VRNRIIAVELLGFVALTLALFGDVLLLPGGTVLSNATTDLAQQFVHWRRFGFGELAKGNLALWNPYIYGGTPYFAGFQSALLYPPNWLYLVLPSAKAINWGIALHVLLSGIFFYAWASTRKLHHLACFLGGALFMLCAPHFLHIYAGHLPNLCTLIWVPALLLCIDRMNAGPGLRWPLVGMLVIAMQIFAGHVQYVYYTSIAVVIYTGLLMLRSPAPRCLAASVAGSYAGAVLLAAIQLLPGVQAGGEGLRGGGLSLESASVFSLPPENLLTWLVPGFFGDTAVLPYWGHCFLWEMNLFISVTGFFLALYAMRFGGKGARIELMLPAVLLMLLALGSFLPWFPLLHRYLPGFDTFRGTSKFTLQATVFLIMLAATGLDRMLREELRRPKALRTALLVAALAGACLSAAIHIAATREGWWPRFMQVLFDLGRAAGADRFSLPFAREAGLFAAKGVLLFALTVFLIGAVVSVVQRRRQLAGLLVPLAVAELLLTAWWSRDTFRLDLVIPQKLAGFFTSHPGDYRVLLRHWHNLGMTLGVPDIWGEDPAVLRRYAELVARSQDMPLDHVSQSIDFRKANPRIFDLLRCRYGVALKPEGPEVFEFSREVMPRLSIIHRWRVLADRDEALDLLATQLDPRKEVILTQAPHLKAVPFDGPTASSVRLLDSSTDHLTVEAELDRPGILLLTDAYSQGWRAWALAGSSQEKYEILPANHAFMGVPLAAGRHRLRLEYLPAAFVAGKWISGISLAVYLAVILWMGLERRLQWKKRMQLSTQASAV